MDTTQDYGPTLSAEYNDLRNCAIGVTVAVPLETIGHMMGTIPAWSWWLGIHSRGNGWMLVCEDPDGGTREVPIGPEAMVRGLRLLAEHYPLHFGRVLDGSWDSDSVDFFLQLIAYGRIVFA